MKLNPLSNHQGDRVERTKFDETVHVTKVEYRLRTVEFHIVEFIAYVISRGKVQSLF